MDVDTSKLDFQGGIAILNIFHGDPPHSLIAYIDQQGKVRGAEVADFAVILAKKEAEKPSREVSLGIKEKIGVDIMSAIYSAMVADVPFYFIVDFNPDVLIDFLKSLFSDFPTEIEIQTNKILDRFAVVVLDKDFYEEAKGEIDIGILYDMVTGLFINYQPESHYMLSFVKKRMKLGHKGQVEIFAEVNRLRLLFKKVIAEFESNQKVSLKKLIKELKLSYREVDYFRDLLRLRGINVDERLIWNPFMK